MPTIRVSPDNVEVAFSPKANILDTLLDAGVPIDHLCGGRARCSTCRVFLLEGLSNVSERTEAEDAMATKLDFPPRVRLACQTTLADSVRLRRLVLDKTDVLLASQLGTPKLAGPAGREAEIAVLFADVVGYTKMSEALPPFDIVHLLNRFFSRTDDVVARNGGIIDNYMGDAVLALFGLHGEPDPALSAVRCGLAVLDVASELSHYVERIYRLSFGVRVGIDFGEVVFGVMGAGASARETVIGDTVNVASRLESANKDTGTDMLISDAVYQLTGDAVTVGERHELDVRGKLGPVVAYEVLSVDDPSDQDE
ncbi:MAG: adenylate/guanylate cyclase domain-containing protein [Actinomycetia bacterium]|nr:adenylate/guanylate cyclase domain-containing protein [Actinomycetes bacterium]